MNALRLNPAMTAKLRSAAVALTAMLVAAAGLTACSASNDAHTENPAAGVGADAGGFHGTLVDPPLRPAHVVLRDTHGAPFDLGRPAPDRATALFFGFTHCDDVCPTTMADLAAARRLLPGALADRVTVIFVTVDPHRDTAPVLAQWLGQFDPDFIGLRGPTELVNQAERSLYLTESGEESAPAADHHTGGHESSKAGADYEVDHSGSVYVFGPADTLLLYTGGTTPQEYADDFTRLLTT
jgi:protein SCO1/2